MLMYKLLAVRNMFVVLKVVVLKSEVTSSYIHCIAPWLRLWAVSLVQCASNATYGETLWKAQSYHMLKRKITALKKIREPYEKASGHTHTYI